MKGGSRLAFDALIFAGVPGNIFKKSAAVLLLAFLCVSAAAFPAVAGDALPLYSFSYQGKDIDTFASYSLVDGVKTKGFRYFVKDGELIVIDNALNTVPDGIFIHFQEGDSYIAVLTKGGKLKSLGTVNFLENLENFRNTGITFLDSNVNSDSTELTVQYKNGSIAAYDAVTGEELYRTGAEEDEDEDKPGILDYIGEYLQDLASRSTASGKSAAAVEAQAVAAMMEKKGYSLSDLAAAGVFSDADALNQFVKTGELNTSGQTEASGEGTGVAGEAEGSGGTAVETSGTAEGADRENTGESSGEAEKTLKPETGNSAESGENGEESSSVESSANNKENSSAELQSKETSGKEATPGEVLDNSEKAAESEAASREAEQSKAESLAAKGNSVVSESAGKNKGKDETESTSEGTGSTPESSSPAESSTADKNGAGGESTALGEEKKKTGSGGESGSTASSETKSTEKSTEAEKKAEAQNEEQEKTSTQGEEADAGTGSNQEEASAEEDPESEQKENLITGENSARYVTVYNAATGSYDIYSEAELLEHPEDPESENEKTGNQNNKKIAELLKVAEDENEERGIGLYVLVILGIVLLAAGLLKLAYSVSGYGKKNRKEPGSSAERKASEEQERP